MSPLVLAGEGRLRRGGLWLAALLAMAPCWATLGESALAQQRQDVRVYPPDAYYLAFAPYFAGEYGKAANAFGDAASGGLRSTEGRWVDSICYHTMTGECYYHMGELGKALDQYDAALKLFLAYPNWLMQVQFPDSINAASNASLQAKLTWGTSGRTTALVNLPDSMLCSFGRLDAAQALREGGVVAQPHFLKVRVQEVVRCTALAISRRHEIMGPACPYDPMTDQLVAALSRRPAPPNHWSQAWISAQLGMLYASAGKPAQAISELENSLMLGGRYDHQLTGMSLVELGHLARQQGKHDEAAKYFYEATFSAAAFDQYDVLDEALREGTLNHMITNPKDAYPPLEGAAKSRLLRDSRPSQASLLIAAADNQASLGQTAAAATLLDQAAKITARRDMAEGAAGARIQYQLARVRFQQGNTGAGATALASALSYQQTGSRRLFQIALCDKLFLAGAVTPREADLLFAEVLREPTAADWKTDPLEELSVLATPHPQPLEHWFELAMQREQFDRALEIADQLRRHRFYSSLPMGGRLLALRWVLEAPPEALSPEAQLQRQDLLGRFPAYQKLSQQADALRKELAAMPLVPDDDAARRKQEELLQRLSDTAAAQELMLQELALRREAAEFCFPPQRKVKDIQAAMSDSQIVLVYVATNQGLYGFSVTKTRYDKWVLREPAKVRTQLASLLRQWGNNDKNPPVAVDSLTDTSWKASAGKLGQQLFPGIKPDDWAKYDELVIVPDGFLWYVPFEALTVDDGKEAAPLIARLSVRYAPTLSTVIPDGRNNKPLAVTAVTVGKLFPGNSESLADEGFARLRDAVPGAHRLPDQLPAPSGRFRALCDRLVVLADIDETARGPYDWSPVQVDRGRPGSSLADWFALPFGGPEQVVLPGFHTAAESSLKRGGTGEELFLATCGLMATGTRTALLSRWRSGGRTSYDLAREFVQELPHASASAAWRRSVQLAMDSEIDGEFEPRVGPISPDRVVKADHPFFWAGYLLVDTGTTPPGDTARVIGREGDDVIPE